jgi:hypothetical protein
MIFYYRPYTLHNISIMANLSTFSPVMTNRNQPQGRVSIEELVLLYSVLAFEPCDPELCTSFATQTALCSKLNHRQIVI